MQSPLEEWLNPRKPLPQRFFTEGAGDIISDDGLTLCWVGIEYVKPIHKVGDLNWVSLKKSRKETAEYLEKAKDIAFDLQDDGWLDHEDAYDIKEELGEPPPLCLPIYLVSVRDAQDVEQLVYVGITRTEQRFLGGHAVAIKLLDPEFNQHQKFIYQCCVWLHFNNEYIALEWLEPEGLAEQFLESVEAQLIYQFQPRFNDKKRKSFSAKLPLAIQIENHIGAGIEGKFLHEVGVYPPKTDTKPA